MIDRNASTQSDKALQDSRKRAMAVLAASDAAAIASHLAALDNVPAAENIRAPECGLVMLRGRIGGDGQAFNLGEATVARAAVRLASGEIGFGYALGRDKEKARLIALCDALAQAPRFRDAVEAQVIAPMREIQKAKTTLAGEQSAATRVDFFTLVRGED